jgi:pimeloyl-ACP methyl ester carboxylesterase
MTSTKPDLAFLHGGGQGSWAWEPTIAALRIQDDACFGKVLALDVPGCGEQRGRTTNGITPADVAQELIAEIERRSMSDIVLVGHSLAGNVLPAIAEARSDLFRRLVYLSCSIPLPGQTVLQMMGNGIHGSNDNEVGWPVDPETTVMHDRYTAMYCEDMGEEQAKSFLTSLDRDNWPAAFFTNTLFDFDMSRVPATYVLCQKDRILPAAWQQIFAERFNAERVVQLDAGHQAMITRPHALAEILRQEGATTTATKPQES